MSFHFNIVINPFLITMLIETQYYQTILKIDTERFQNVFFASNLVSKIQRFVKIQ